jgi:transposase InsO family protein
MVQFVSALLFYLLTFLRSRHNLGLEILALRQQLAVLKRRHPRPRLGRSDRLFWVALRSRWRHWSDALLIVKPGTVVGWHRACRGWAGRRSAPDLYEALQRMAKENPSWGAPRIHGELLKLGFKISERTVSRYLARRTPSSEEARNKWAAFLKNHKEAIAAMDFFTVPTLTFRLLCCFFVIEHGRRKILHFNVTEHPTGEWICQQLREAFPNSVRYKYAILDRDSKFSGEVLTILAASGIQAVRTSIRSPWQNGIAERWVGGARRECFDHVIAFSEAHVRRIAAEYIAYFHEDRTHLGLDEGHAEHAAGRAKAGRSEIGIAAASRRTAPAVRLESCRLKARRGIPRGLDANTDVTAEPFAHIEFTSPCLGSGPSRPKCTLSGPGGTQKSFPKSPSESQLGRLTSQEACRWSFGEPQVAHLPSA